MKKLMIGSLIGLAALVAALGLLGNGTVVAAGKPGVPFCLLGTTGVTQHGNVIIGTSAADTINCSFVDPQVYNGGYRIVGLGRNDNITGSDGNDFILGGSGNDRITGMGGSDTIDGGRDDGGFGDICIGGEVKGQLDQGDKLRNCENTLVGDPNT